jgi:hypothetical protein
MTLDLRHITIIMQKKNDLGFLTKFLKSWKFSGLVNGEGYNSHEASLARGSAEGDQLEDGVDAFGIAQKRRKHGVVGRIGHGRRNSTGRRKSPGAVRLYEVQKF